MGTALRRLVLGVTMLASASPLFSQSPTYGVGRRPAAEELQSIDIDVAPDGKRFLVVEPSGSPRPVALIQNWIAALKK